jgi:hypothetical protein
MFVFLKKINLPYVLELSFHLENYFCEMKANCKSKKKPLSITECEK